MAAGTSIEELKKDSSDQLREARAALGSEMVHVREDLHPKHIAHVIMDRHRGVIIGGGIVAGLALSYFLLRPRRAVELRALPPLGHVPAPQPEASVVGKVASGLIKLATPFLIKALIRELTSSGRVAPAPLADEYASPAVASPYGP